MTRLVDLDELRIEVAIRRLKALRPLITEAGNGNLAPHMRAELEETISMLERTVRSIEHAQAVLARLGFRRDAK